MHPSDRQGSGRRADGIGRFGHCLFDMGLGDDRRDIAWFGDPRFTPVWGVILLRTEDGTVLGALGESGGTPAQDEEIGQIGARAFAAL